MSRSARRSPRASTGVRRRGVRRLAGTALTLATLTVPALVYAPSASAGLGACYRQNSWSFRHYSYLASDRSRGIAYIDAWHNTTCSGDSILRGQVEYRASSRYVKLTAYDYARDSYAVTVYTHGPSVTSNGAANPPVVGGGDLSSFSTPYNFWIRVGGQQNSVSQPFPIP